MAALYWGQDLSQNSLPIGGDREVTAFNGTSVISLCPLKESWSREGRGDHHLVMLIMETFTKFFKVSLKLFLNILLSVCMAQTSFIIQNTTRIYQS